jgi:hypothetical protein
VLDHGILHLEEATFTILKAAPNEGDRKYLDAMITRRDDLLVSHIAGLEAFSGINARLLTIASAIGYRQQLLTLVNDQEGRPVFAIFRFDNSASP